MDFVRFTGQVRYSVTTSQPTQTERSKSNDYINRSVRILGGECWGELNNYQIFSYFDIYLLICYTYPIEGLLFLSVIMLLLRTCKWLIRFAKVHPRISATSLSLISFLVFSNSSSADGVSSVSSVICQVLGIFRGRYGRAIVAVKMLDIGWNMAHGNISWKDMLTSGCGAVMLFAPESIVFTILPATITGISGSLPDGTVLQATSTYSPQEIMSHVCPEMSYF